jgi:Flp pilus assembly protein TadG
MTRLAAVLTRIRRFHRSEQGGATVWSLFLSTAIAMIGGYAVDVSNLMTSRTDLQIAADAAAHAALLSRSPMSADRLSADEARAIGVEMAALNLPVEEYGETVRPEDIVFGTWDRDTLQFTADEDSKSAVQVTAWRHSLLDNPVPVYLLQLAGLSEWDLQVVSVFETYQPTCLREGFVAEDVVDIQSNNSYSNGFCIHSNSYVSLNSNNYFEPGTVVSMPDLDDIDLPNSGYETNDGLQDALREGSWNIRIVSRIQNIIDGLLAFDREFLPDYITYPSAVTLPSNTVKQEHLVAGRLYRYTCNGGKRMTIDKDVTMSKVVLITNCEIKFNEGVALEDAIVATTDTGAKSMNSPGGLRLGKDDGCAEGNSAQLVTMGSVDVAADLQLYGAQIIARDDIQFAANANGIQGAALVAGGEISGTSNMEMRYCGSGMKDNFEADYFRMVN